MFLQLVLVVAFLCLAVLLLLVLFEPGLPYHIIGQSGHRGVDFVRLMGVLVDASVQRMDRAEVLVNGASFYEAELSAIASARSSVHVEAFIFHPSAVGDRFVSTLIECAKRGVRVRIVVDAIGSFPTPDSYFDSLRAAGGKVYRYQPIRWYTLKRFNNRSHRELIIVDGQIGFIGGAGIAAHWTDSVRGAPPWRDTMLRVTGSVVDSLQSAFLENWLEASGEILVSTDAFPLGESSADQAPALVVTGTPSPARASRARVLFQLLLASAADSIEINSPYFLPDRSARRELIKAAARGVRVRVIVPGRYNNHPITRLASRRQYGELLAARVRIFEYQPGMIHAKIMIVDGEWIVVGSTNFDSRSFELNDEVNLAIVDATLASRMRSDFDGDVAESIEVTMAGWKRRSLVERVAAIAGIVLERQE